MSKTLLGAKMMFVMKDGEQVRFLPPIVSVTLPWHPAVSEHVHRAAEQVRDAVLAQRGWGKTNPYLRLPSQADESELFMRHHAFDQPKLALLARRFAEASDADQTMRAGGTYDVVNDRVRIMPLDGNLWSLWVACHEAGHWTGFASRLHRRYHSRAPTGDVSDRDYAAEECVAESCAAILFIVLGVLTKQAMPRAAQYISRYLERMGTTSATSWPASQGDHHLEVALRDGQRAAQYLLDRFYPEWLHAILR